MSDIIKDRAEGRFFCVKKDGDDFLYLSKDGRFDAIKVSDNALNYYFNTKQEIEAIIGVF